MGIEYKMPEITLTMNAPEFEVVQRVLHSYVEFIEGSADRSIASTPAEVQKARDEVETIKNLNFTFKPLEEEGDVVV